MGESFKFCRRLIKDILPAFLIFYFIDDKKKIKILLITLLSSLFIEFIYSLVVYSEHFADVLFYNKSFPRMQGYPPEEGKWPTFMLLSMKLELSFCLSYILILDKKMAFGKNLLKIMMASTLIALFFNNTRMAWIIVIIMFIVLTGFYLKSIKKILIAVFSSFVLISCLVYTQPWLQHRIQDTIYMRDGSSQLHHRYVKDGIVMIKDRPILGWGMGQFGKIYNESYRSDITNELIEKFHEHVPVPYAHNMFVDMAIDSGLLGLIGYIICYGNFLFFSLRDWFRYKSISGLMFFAIISCFVLHGFSEKVLSFGQIVEYQYCLLGMYLVYRKYEIDEYNKNIRG